MNTRSGLIGGLLKLLLLDVAFEWLEKKFGFGRGCSCTGCGCGFIILLIALALACSILTGTNWTQFRF